jgi:stress-induced morphogen
VRVYQFRHIRAAASLASRWRRSGARYDRRMSAERLQGLLAQSFPDAEQLEVVDRTGGGDHFQVTVAAAAFDGLPLVQQHRLVYDALAGPLADGTIHELRIKTRGTAT